jgi:quaternary ammonium compound-resistance protein SugE
MAWIYLFCASCLEVCWIYSVKYLNVQRIREIQWAHLFKDSTQFTPLVPLIGYIVFGVTNIVLFSMAMKQLPASTAFAVWMAMALVGVKIADTLIYKEPFNFMHVLYIAFILIGIFGLKKTL